MNRTSYVASCVDGKTAYEHAIRDINKGDTVTFHNHALGEPCANAMTYASAEKPYGGLTECWTSEVVEVSC